MKNVSDQASKYIEKPLLSFLKKKAAEHFGEKAPFQVIVFGSRARGDHQDRSDYDLAVRVGADLEEKWSEFAVEVREDAPTLKKIDLVNIKRCPKDLRERILSEGKLVYEQKTR